MGRQESPERYGVGHSDIFLPDGGEKELQSYPRLKGRVPLDGINVLPQPRKTIEEIETLADNISLLGLLQPLTIARCDNERSCQLYLDGFNSLWGTETKLEDLTRVTEKEKEVFYILIAGERRLKALRLLQKEDRLNSRYFRGQKVEAIIYVNISPHEAMNVQASENIHMPVPPHEEARFYYDCFRLRKEKDPGLSMAQFAREVGRSEGKIIGAIRFCELPVKIQRLVEAGNLVYGVAVEISRLQRETNISEDGLFFWAELAMTGNKKLPDLRKDISQEIYRIRSGQGMFEIFTEEQERLMRKLHVRKVVAREMVMGLWAFIYYFRTLHGFLEEKLLGEEDSPFSEGSPVRIYKALIQEIKRDLPYLRKILRKKEYQEGKKVLARAENILSRLEEKLPKTPEDYPYLSFPLGTTPSD